MIFIVGVGRSGTSLLQNMLHGHADIQFLPETSILRRYIFSGRLNNEVSKRGCQSVVNLLLEDPNFSRLNLTKSEVSELLNEYWQSSSDEITFYKAICARYINNSFHSEPTLVGDKDPRLIEFLGLLFSKFPDCKVIHIYRDPRDVVLSKKKAEWSKHRVPFVNTMIGAMQFRVARILGPTLFGDRYLEVCYEDLISNPSRTLARLCESLGVSFQESMLNIEQNGEQLVANDEIQWKETSKGPLMRNNFKKWQNGELSDEQISMIEKISSELMQYGGYEINNHGGELKLGALIRVHTLKLLSRIVITAYIIMKIIYGTSFKTERVSSVACKP